MDGRTLWQIVYNDLRTAIEQGEYPPGDKLPSERQLTEKYGFARSVIKTAFTHLDQSGMTTALSGSLGRVVRERLEISFDASKFEVGAYEDDVVRGVDQWSSDVERQGWQAHQAVSVTQRTAPLHVARWLDVEPGTRLCRRRRIRSVRKPEAVSWTPVMIADSWFPEDIARLEVDGIAPLMIERDITMPGGIVRSLGIHQAKFVDEIRSRMPRDDEIELLALPKGAPVGEHARVGIDDTGRRIRVLVSVFAGDRQFVRYELAVDQQDRDVTR